MNNLSIRKMTEVSKKKKKGFTLVELIIVIAIIAILAAMAIPKFSSIRIDAKVSNDVVAAKNIQTLVATGVANGTIKVPDTETTDGTLNGEDEISKKLDGKATSGKAEAMPTLNFNYKVDTKGGIEVYAGKYKLYPDNDSTLRKEYAADAAK